MKKNIAIFYESRRDNMLIVHDFLNKIVLKDIGDEDEVCFVSTFYAKKFEALLYKIIKGHPKMSYLMYKRKRVVGMDIYVQEMVKKEGITDAVFFCFTKKIPQKFEIAIHAFAQMGIKPYFVADGSNTN